MISKAILALSVVSFVMVPVEAIYGTLVLAAACFISGLSFLVSAYVFADAGY